MTSEEFWKDIPGYEGLYQVSSFGRVKSLERYVNHWRGGQLLLKERILKISNHRDGYKKVILWKKGRQKTIFVHRLVLLGFIPNSENKPFVNHINGNKTDNRVENLEWCTHEENEKHALANGLKCPRGELHPRSTLSNEDVRIIRVMHREKLCTQTKMGEIFNVSRYVIADIIRGKSWKHIH